MLTPNISPSEPAGSVLAIRTVRASANIIASAAAHVDLPTPPLPATHTIRVCTRDNSWVAFPRVFTGSEPAEGDEGSRSPMRRAHSRKPVQPVGSWSLGTAKASGADDVA